MNTLWKKTAVLTLSSAVALTGLTGCSKSLDGTQTVTTVNGESVQLGVLSLTVRYQQASTELMYQTYFGSSASSMWDTVADEDTGETYGDQSIDSALDSLEDTVLLRQHAEEYGVEISEEDQDKITAAAEAFMEANDDATIAALGVNQEILENYLELYYYNQYMYDPMVADVDTEVSDEEAAQTGITYVAVSESSDSSYDSSDYDSDYYDSDSDTDSDSDGDAQTKAELILELALMEEEPDLETIAQEIDESLSATSTSFTTNPGEDDEDTSDVPEELQEAAKTMTDGEIYSQVIESDGTYYILQLDAAFDEEATEEEKETIIEERQSDAYDELLDEWRESSEITRDEKVLDKLTLTSTELFTFKEEEEDSSEDSSVDSSVDSSEDAAVDETEATDEEASEDEETSDETETTEEETADDSTEDTEASEEE